MRKYNYYQVIDSKDEANQTPVYRGTSYKEALNAYHFLEIGYLQAFKATEPDFDVAEADWNDSNNNPILFARWGEK